MRNLISIIIPMYNAENYIDRCVKSIMEQQYKDIEIILVDDGSTDNTKIIARKLQEKYDKIKLIILEKNCGVSTARNIAIQKAHGEYIAFVDIDDFVEKDIYVELCNNMNNDIDLAVCNYTNSEKMESDDKRNIRVIEKNQFYKEVLENKNIRGYVHNKLFKAKIIKENNICFRKDIYICEDLLFVCEYMKYGNKVSINNRRLYHYISNNNGAYNKKFGYKWKTVLDAYNTLLGIYNEVSIDNVIFLKYVYILVCSEVLYRDSKSKYFSKEERKKIKVRANQFYDEVKGNSKISKKKKIKALLYLTFPNFIGEVKKILGK